MKDYYWLNVESESRALNKFLHFVDNNMKWTRKVLNFKGILCFTHNFEPTYNETDNVSYVYSSERKTPSLQRTAL